MAAGTKGMIEKYASVGPFRVRYLDNEAFDAARAIVLLHDGGWGASAEGTWGRTFAHLPGDFRVIAPDLLGFGGSDKAVFLDRSPYSFRVQAVFDLLSTLKIRTPVHWVGNSFGGSVVLRALECTGLRGSIASATTISGTGGPWRTPLALRELSKFDGTPQDMDRLMRLVTEPFDGWKEYLQARIDWATAPGHYQSMMAPHLQPPEGIRRTRPADSFPATLAGCDIPVHLVAGRRDLLVEPSWTDALSEAIGEGCLVTKVDASHSPNLFEPAETWQIVEHFIRKVDTGPVTPA